MSGPSVNEFENLVIRASAGTGKTFELSNRFLRLLASGVESETILATTFTRKGGGEILDRIVQRLASAALNDDAAATLAEQLKCSGLNQLRFREMLGGLMKQLHRLQIGTLDSFFHRIVQAFRLELGLPAKWSIVDQQRIAMLQMQAIREILREKTVIDLLHLLNKGDAVRKVAELVRASVDQHYETYLDSNQDAWNRLPNVGHFQADKDFSDVIETLESISYPHGSQKKQIAKEIGLMGCCQWKELTESSIFKAIVTGSNSYYRPLPEACLLAYEPIIEQCRGYVIDRLTRQNLSTYRLLDEFGQRLEAEKVRMGELRFGDITRKLESYVEDVDRDRFSFRMDHHINHLLLDEFQDTSLAQWNIIRPFAERTTADSANKSFFCVGDLKQAIYGWRNGVAEIFDRVENDLPNIAESPSLTTSYRSSPAVIEGVNQVFLNLDRYQPKDECVAQAVADWATRFQPHQTTKTELPGCVTIDCAPRGDKKSGATHDELMLSAAVELIRELYEQMSGGSIGVLARTNKLIGKLIFLLREAGIPASEEGGNSLIDSAAVETILSALQLADHPGDSIARFHLSNSPLTVPLNLICENESSQYADSGRIKRVQTAAHAASEQLRLQLSRQGYGSTVEQLARVLASHCTQRELSRLQQIVQQAFNFDRSHSEPATRLRPTRFVNYIRDEFRATDKSSAQVRVMTIHKSKGLEFDVVVLPMNSRSGWFSKQPELIIGRESRTQPINLVSRYASEVERSLLPAEFEAAYQERRRSQVLDNLCVLYVAMTRAVHATHVVMSYDCKPDASSGAGVLLSTLVPGCTADMRDEGRIFTLGDPDWHQTLSSVKKSIEPTESQRYYLQPSAGPPAVLLASGIRSGRGIRRISPSELEGGGAIRMGSIFSTESKATQLEHGSMIHACFEKIGWLEDGQPSRDELLDHLKSRGLISENVETVLADFERWIRQSNVSSILTQSDYRKTWLTGIAGLGETDSEPLRINYSNERSFAIEIEHQLMQGTIDRLVLICENDRLVAADILDYKTDIVDEQGLESRIQFYRPQLEAYRLAVSRIFELATECISARLVFVATDKIITLFSKASSGTKAKLQLPENSRVTVSGRVEKPVLKPRNQMELWSDE